MSQPCCHSPNQQQPAFLQKISVCQKSLRFLQPRLSNRQPLLKNPLHQLLFFHSFLTLFLVLSLSFQNQQTCCLSCILPLIFLQAAQGVCQTRPCPVRFPASCGQSLYAPHSGKKSLLTL